MSARRLRYVIPALVVLGVLALVTVPRDESTVAAPADACTIPPRSKTDREVDAYAKKFMVAAAHPLAVEAGCRILLKGGRVADAAVAVQAVLAVVEPHASGLAGGTLINHWDGDKRKIRFFDGYARAPKTVTENLRTPTAQEQKDLRTDRFPNDASATGRSVGVPGTLAVLADVHGVYGKLPWKELFDDAIRLAQDGFPMPQPPRWFRGGSAGGSAATTRTCAPVLRRRRAEAGGDDHLQP
jgi:gamma-glutamyltranspeptidase/glutathione hydrolase